MINKFSKDKKLLSVQNLSKGFSLYKSPSNRFLEILLNIVVINFMGTQRYYFRDSGWAYFGNYWREWSWKVNITQNSSRYLIPDGSVQINGRITGLLELGTGFNPEISGLENIEATEFCLE